MVPLFNISAGELSRTFFISGPRPHPPFIYQRSRESRPQKP
ncbi:hypothetical protein HMPREF1986_01716 [Oribacterium sp. oral taxon 078 str. F0263]|nr:hypothetical protein HMPREF1986_01716 [Oribacterium sp. oral taxon 078 str. F0263]